MNRIITRDTLINMISTANTERQQHIVGRALVALFKNQTDVEKSCNITKVDNNIGFAACDAKSGSITAKYYIKHGKLLEWQMAKWLKPTKGGHPYIAKYWKQLDDAARAKRAAV